MLFSPSPGSLRRSSAHALSLSFFSAPFLSVCLHRSTKASWAWCSWWTCWLEWRLGWSTSLKWASSTSDWLHTRWEQLGWMMWADRWGSCAGWMSTTGGKTFIWCGLIWKHWTQTSWFHFECNRPGFYVSSVHLRCSSTPTWAARCLASDPFRRTRLRLFTPHWWEQFRNTDWLAGIMLNTFK